MGPYMFCTHETLVGAFVEIVCGLPGAVSLLWHLSAGEYFLPNESIDTGGFARTRLAFGAMPVSRKSGCCTAPVPENMTR